MVKHSAISFEYDAITSHIFIGTNQCCQGRFQKGLFTQGIRADISLEDTKIDTPFGVSYYLWLPTKNHHAPSIEQLHMGVHFLQDCVTHNIKVYVHCERGHGRAPTLVIAYLAAVEGMTLAKAVSFVKSKRPVIHPNKVQLAAVKKFLSRGKKDH